jgi:hypothetical protein
MKINNNIKWECCCGLNGSDYPRSDTIPKRAVLIRLHGCDKCDPHGEDSYEFFDKNGELVPVEEAAAPEERTSTTIKIKHG